MGPSSSKCHRQMLVVDFVILINQSSLNTIKPATLQVTTTRVNTIELYWQVSLLCRNISGSYQYMHIWLSRVLGSIAESNIYPIFSKWFWSFVKSPFPSSLNSLVETQVFKFLSKIPWATWYPQVHQVLSNLMSSFVTPSIHVFIKISWVPWYPQVHQVLSKSLELLGNPKCIKTFVVT